MEEIPLKVNEQKKIKFLIIHLNFILTITLKINDIMNVHQFLREITLKLKRRNKIKMENLSQTDLSSWIKFEGRLSV